MASSVGGGLSINPQSLAVLFPGGGVQSAARFFFSLARQGLEKESSIIKALQGKKRNKNVIEKQKIGDFYIILRYNENRNRIKTRDTLL